MSEQALVLQLAHALARAKSFIENGSALGYIRMPDADVPDPAHQTLPAIKEALAAFQAHQAHLSQQATPAGDGAPEVSAEEAAQRADCKAEPELLAALAQATEEFEDCEETVVPYEMLMQLCAKGWMECSRFQLTPLGREVLAQQPSSLFPDDTHSG